MQSLTLFPNTIKYCFSLPSLAFSTPSHPPPCCSVKRDRHWWGSPVRQGQHKWEPGSHWLSWLLSPVIFFLCSTPQKTIKITKNSNSEAKSQSATVTPWILLVMQVVQHKKKAEINPILVQVASISVHLRFTFGLWFGLFWKASQCSSQR